MGKVILLLALLLTTAQAQEPEVVSVHAYGNGTKWGSLGSGFVAYTDGQVSGIITNMHVCSDNYVEVAHDKKSDKFTYYKEISVTLADKKDIRGDILAVDVHQDLCFLEVYATLSPRTLSKRTELTYNESLWIISPDIYKDRKVSYKGLDTLKDGYAKYHKEDWEIKGAFQHGMSGSGVIDHDGQIVGVFWAVDEDDTSRGFMVGINALRNFLDKANEYIYKNLTRPIELD